MNAAITTVIITSPIIPPSFAAVVQSCRRSGADLHATLVTAAIATYGIWLRVLFLFSILGTSGTTSVAFMLGPLLHQSLLQRQASALGARRESCRRLWNPKTIMRAKMRNGVQRRNVIKRVHHRVLLLPPPHSTLAFRPLSNGGSTAILTVIPVSRLRSSWSASLVFFFHLTAFALRTLFHFGKWLHDGLKRIHIVSKNMCIATTQTDETNLKLAVFST